MPGSGGAEGEMQQALLSRRLGLILLVVVLVAVLSGCAGGLIASLLKWVTIGKLAANVNDLLDEFDEDHKDPVQYQVLFDGYPLGQRLDNTGELDLRGLPTGRHLISVVHDSYHAGFHHSLEITEGQTELPLAEINPLEGGVISGKVEREASGGGRTPVANTLVVGVFDGATMLRKNGGAIITIPPAEGQTTYVMGYTDSDGDYRLGPCIGGSWLVTTALPGYYGDARVVIANRLADSQNQDLYLPDQPLDATAMVLGSVTENGLEGLAEALVYTDLETAYNGQLTATRADEVEDEEAGFEFIASPWFAWTRLGTLTEASGAYTLRTAPGNQMITGFKYEYRGRSGDFELDAGEDLDLDFDLAEL